MRAQADDLRMSEAFVLRFTGLPSSRKTTLARIMADKLRDFGMKVELLDGDEVRVTVPRSRLFQKRQ